MKDETVLFNPANNKFCVLNVTAAYIWQLLESPATHDEITARIAGHFGNADPAQVERDVERTLKELCSIDCVVLKQ